jgi:hypothetical protein
LSTTKEVRGAVKEGQEEEEKGPWMVVSMGTYQHLMMAPEGEGSNIVACLHLLGLIWIPMVPEEEGPVLPVLIGGLLA